MAHDSELLPPGEPKPRSDLVMIAKAIRDGWPIDPKLKAELTSRMREVVNKRTVQVPGKDGGMEDRADVADNHAIAAGRVLVAADQVNQTDYWNADKNARIDAGQATEVHQFQAGKVIEMPVPKSLMDPDDARNA